MNRTHKRLRVCFGTHLLFLIGRKELRKLQSREDSSKNTAKPQAQAIQSDLLVVHDISTELETSAGGYLVLDMNPEEPQTSRNFASNSAVNGDFKNTVVQGIFYACFELGFNFPKARIGVGNNFGSKISVYWQPGLKIFYALFIFVCPL